MTSPLVSFVIPCYNYGRYLRDCLHGIFTQEGEYDIEVIAVNDGSPDDTIDILREWKDSRLKIIDRKENRGHVYTVNEGFAAARGKYLVRIDPDDRHRPSFLRTLVPVLESQPQVGMAYGNVALIDAQGQIHLEGSDTQHGGRDFCGNEFVSLLKSNFICAPTVIARREAWMSAWPVPEGLAFNDWYFNIMIAREWDSYYSNQVLADYRVHDSNWHRKISLDGSEERSVLQLLDRVYQETETSSELEQAKRSARAAVYGSHYLDFATKYFGNRMHSEARRCFRQAWEQDSSLLESKYQGMWAASCLPPKMRIFLKYIIRTIHKLWRA